MTLLLAALAVALASPPTSAEDETRALLAKTVPALLEEHTVPGAAVALVRGGEVVWAPGFGMADVALWYACFGAIGMEAMAVTSEMSIRYLRPCVGDELFAEAVLDSVGRRTIVGSVRVWTDDRDRPTSVAQGSYVRPSPDGER